MDSWLLGTWLKVAVGAGRRLDCGCGDLPCSRTTGRAQIVRRAGHGEVPGSSFMYLIFGTYLCTLP
jgi:hypothetical protein